MTRSSRYCGESNGRSKSYKSPHSRKFRRRKDNDSRRSARCQQRSDISAGHYEPKHYEKDHRAIGRDPPHHSNGRGHQPSRSGIQHRNVDSCPEYIWDFDGSSWESLNLSAFKTMKEMWDKLTSDQRMAAFENLPSEYLEYVRRISYGGCTLEQFGSLVYRVQYCNVGGSPFNDTINVDVAIKRMYRRGRKGKFVSHRNHKEKYFY